MKKKFNHYVSLSLLLLSVLPFSLVSAETVEEVPTGETTISSMADDPLKELKEKAANQVPTIESTPESESVEDTPTSESETKEDVPKTEDTNETKPKPQARGGGIGPQAVNLIEGVDIDADFAQLLRTNQYIQNLGSSWSGYGKGVNQLTDDDMSSITRLGLDNHNLSTSTLKGLEYAKNLQILTCMNAQLTSLDISQNSKLVELNCWGNKLTSLDLTQNPNLEYVNARANSLNSMNITQNPKLRILLFHTNPGITSLDTSSNPNLEELECQKTSITNLDFSSNPKLKKVLCSYVSTLSNINISGAYELQSLDCRETSITSLDASQNSKLEILICNDCKLTNLIVAGADALKTLDCPKNQITDLDVSQNKELVRLNCMQNLLTTLIIAGADELQSLSCNYNNLTTLDASQNSKLEYLYCNINKITNLDVSGTTALIKLECQTNELVTLDVSQKKNLEILYCQNNRLTNLSITGADVLQQLTCDNNKLSNIDASQNSKLVKLTCADNQLLSLLVNGADDLSELTCNNNKLTTLDVSQNEKLQKLNCSQNSLTVLSLNGAKGLKEISCGLNDLTSIDVSQLANLQNLECSQNKLKNLMVAGADALQMLTCPFNKLTKIDISQNLNLTGIDCRSNQISDITSAYGLSQLTSFNFRDQEIYMPVPRVTNNQATVDILKTSSQSGLTPSIGIVGAVAMPNGDLIELSNITRESLDNAKIGFVYDGSKLTEGAISGFKEFSGVIQLYSVSDLETRLKPKDKKVYSGGNVDWTWTIENISSMKAEDIRTVLDLPMGLNLKSSSIKVDGSAGTLGDIDGTNSLGDLAPNQTIEITFTTTATGTADEWIEVKGDVKWKDTTPSSPYSIQTKESIQILDDEQTYTPKPKNLAITSVPLSFNFGIKYMQSTARTFGLNTNDYQSNTNVVTDGFYTRIKDDRAISTGWKLTAKLSDFKDSSNQPMPNGTGTTLKLENMSIERVTDRDTPQEVIDPTPSGSDVPSSVQATETLVAGQSTAKTIVSAQPNEGQDTWQLRMPFDKVSLNIPANAGKKGKVYKANLTWSLDDTP